MVHTVQTSHSSIAEHLIFYEFCVCLVAAHEDGLSLYEEQCLLSGDATFM